VAGVETIVSGVGVEHPELSLINGCPKRIVFGAGYLFLAYGKLLHNSGWQIGVRENGV